MTDYKNLKSYFPFGEYREGQEEILEKIQKGLLDKNIKYIIVEAPVGSGKSGYAIAAAGASKDSYVATANKQLQRQYSKDFSEILTEMKGRSNYECVKYSKPLNYVNCSNASCRKKKLIRLECYRKEICLYMNALKIASESEHVLFNFAAYLSFINYAPTYFQDRSLLIIDEAHQAQGWLTNFIQISFTRKFLIDLGIFHELEKIIYYEDVELENYYDFVKKIFPRISEVANDYATDPKIREKAILYLNKINQFFTLCPSNDDLENFLITREDEKNSKIVKKVIFQPIDVSTLADTYMFRSFQKVLLMSATILDFDTYCDTLGINENEALFIKVDSSFPIKNRPFIFNTVGYFTYKNREELFPRIIEQTRDILSEYPDEKGIIHGTSYICCNRIFKELKNDRILYPQNSLQQKKILDEHIESKEPTVLLSPSLTEGIDLKDQLARFQIMVKTPYPRLDDPLIKKRMDLYPDFYNYQTLLTMVQSYGRAVRSKDDWAHTYILDDMYISFVEKNSWKFPKWFIEAFNEAI